jgi:predicted nucleotidyltransferase
MPNMGSNIPNMGINKVSAQLKQRTSLVDALFSSTQQRVLGMLFGQPDRSFFATELINMLGVGSGAVQRELARLAESGLVTVRKIGTQKHYQANPDSPVFHELVGLISKTVGLAEPLRVALAPFADRIKLAFVYGSVAQGSDTASSDIDLMLVSEGLSYADVFEALQAAEARLGRPVNPTLYTPAEWTDKLQSGNGFAAKVAERRKLFLLGTEQDLM